MILMLFLSQLVLPVMASEEPFDVNSLVETYRYTKDSETGTRSFHEDHGIGFTLPSAYSAVEDGLVTSIKNQGRTGMCWAFALIGSMESNAIKRGLTDLGTSLDLSEAHLAKNSFRYEVDTLGLNAKDSVTPRSELEFIDMGFSVVHGLFTLTRGMGPVRESQAPFSYDYQQMSDNVMNGTFYHREFTLQNGIVPWMFDEESVKRLVYENGAVACAYRSNGDEYYGYVKSGGMPNHGAQIVGWDDSIDRNKFLPEPASQDGAWLIKNSWGNSAAYFWLSYDSTVSEVMSAEMAPQDAYDYKYHYDMANFSSEYDLQAGEEVKIANIFTTQKTTATQTERIHAVSVGFASMNTVYSLQLYKNPVGDNPESGTPLLDEPLQGVKIHRGFYTISLPQSFEVAKNDQIAVVFTIKNRNRNHIASIEVSESFDGYNYQTKEVTEPNQSFIKRANQSWKDMHEEQKVIRIQMLTNVDSENTVGTKTLEESDMHLRDTLLTYSGECVEPMVIIDNDELKEMMHYGIRYENNLNVGTGKVIVYGVNEYEGSSVELPFTIQGTTFDHELFNVSYEQEHIQTGSQVRPQVSVTYYDRILKEGQDYEIQYGTNLVDNETDNDGSFTIIGKGSYTGEKTYYFNIRNPKYNKQNNCRNIRYMGVWK
jgi:C1A family cysteine protease